jgi:hypothetical protein
MNNPLRPELGNPKQAANPLLWAFDNWIYSAHYTRKFRFEGGQFSVGVTTFRGQWGLAQDNDGRLSALPLPESLPAYVLAAASAALIWSHLLRAPCRRFLGVLRAQSTHTDKGSSASLVSLCHALLV